MAEHRPLIILIVEDDPLSRTAEVFALRQAGYRTLEAGSVAEGEVCLECERPDLALVDVGLPDGTGWSITRRLARDHIPVIVLTSRSDWRDRAEGYRLGAEAYLTKPLGLAALVANVNGVLRRTAAAAWPPDDSAAP